MPHDKSLTDEPLSLVRKTEEKRVKRKEKRPEKSDEQTPEMLRKV